MLGISSVGSSEAIWELIVRILRSLFGLFTGDSSGGYGT